MPPGLGAPCNRPYLTNDERGAKAEGRTTKAVPFACYPPRVVPTQAFVGAVSRLIASQPHSQGKVEAAWHMAVGGAMARLSTPVRDKDGIVFVRARDGRVAGQLEVHRKVIEGRLRDVLGPQGRTFTLV